MGRSWLVYSKQDPKFKKRHCVGMTAFFIAMNVSFSEKRFSIVLIELYINNESLATISSKPQLSSWQHLLKVLENFNNSEIFEVEII